MGEKTFIVSHPKALFPISITGKSLREACKKEGLDPAFWKEVMTAPMEEVENLGETPRDAGSEDN